MAMASYLSSVTADYTTTELYVTPQNIMEETPVLSQIVHESDGGTIAVVTLAEKVGFDVTLQWDIISEADSATILDFWVDPYKGNGMARTFYWRHPLDSNTYTSQFFSSISQVSKTTAPGYKEISSIKLRVTGVKP
jgi:hypothetical protein